MLIATETDAKSLSKGNTRMLIVEEKEAIRNCLTQVKNHILNRTYTNPAARIAAMAELRKLVETMAISPIQGD